jgi:hypothetical protein
MDKKEDNQTISMVGPANKTYQLSYAFKQQLMQAWRPKPTLKCAITVYAIIGLIFFAMGISILVMNDKIFENFHRYDDKCPQIGANCEFTFQIEADIIDKPIYFYYQVKGFYQNHRRYMQSVSYEQLRDGVLKNSTEISACQPVVYNRENFYSKSVTNKTLDPDQPAFPCGLIARSYFNDTFKLFRLVDNSEININSTGIAWPDDKTYKFKNADLDAQWIDVTNERFITWMKISPFTDFRKSWGIINDDLLKGTYKIVVNNNWNSSIFGGEKWIILSQANSFGGKNEFLAYCYLAVGALSIILAIIFIFRKIRRPKGMLDERIKAFS